jgi:hypothetical protein
VRPCTCSICGQKGHNTRTCPNRVVDEAHPSWCKCASCRPTRVTIAEACAAAAQLAELWSPPEPEPTWDELLGVAVAQAVRERVVPILVALENARRDRDDARAAAACAEADAERLSARIIEMRADFATLERERDALRGQLDGERRHVGELQGSIGELTGRVEQLGDELGATQEALAKERSANVEAQEELGRLRGLIVELEADARRAPAPVALEVRCPIRGRSLPIVQCMAWYGASARATKGTEPYRCADCTVAARTLEAATRGGR